MTVSVTQRRDVSGPVAAAKGLLFAVDVSFSHLVSTRSVHIVVPCCSPRQDLLYGTVEDCMDVTLGNDRMRDHCAVYCRWQPEDLQTRHSAEGV